MNERDARAQAIAHLERLQREGVWGLTTAGAPDVSCAAGDTAQTGSAPEAPETGEPGQAPASSPPAVAGQGGESTDAAPTTLDQLAAAASDCQLCRLCEGRTQVVYGVGNPDARLMFIGEGPGRDEDLQGEPFVGAAGQLLNRIIGAMGLKREEVYIANTVKCRPPNNRNPLEDELAACRPYLLQQVELVGPELIVLLGRVAMQAVLETEAPLGRMRGQLHSWNGIPVVCTYHPAYLLRTPEDKGKTWADMQTVMERLGLERS